MSVIDLNTPPPDHNFSIKVERVETAGERTVRLFKDLVLFLTAIAFVSLIAWLCFHALLSDATSADEKKWAMSILSAAAGGLIGYLIRK